MKWFLLPVFVLLFIGYTVCAGCTSSKSNAQVVKVHPNGTWKLPIQSRHYIHNVVVSRVFENRTVLAVLSLNSNETPHIYDGRYENRTKLKRHHGGYVVDIVFLNATFADGGTYSSLVSAHHETITVCHRIYVIGKPTMPLITLNGSNTVSEERFARLTCSSQSTTTPRNPDWPLRYMYKVNNTEITAASDTHLRYMVKTKELMIAGITKADGNMNITCTVWEENDENGTTNNLSSSFVLKVSDKLKYDNPSPSEEHIQQKHQESSSINHQSKQEGWECGKAFTVMTVVLSSVILILSVGIVIQCIRQRGRRKKMNCFLENSRMTDYV